MDADEILLEAESKMDDAVAALKKKLQIIRTGRANPALVENIEVNAYDTAVPLMQLAQIGIPEARLIVIKPYDPSTLKDIEKAILASNLGLTPQSDGQFIRLTIPGLTQERRNKLADEVSDIGEQIKISIRNIRREANKEVDKAEKNKEFSEDDSYKAKDAIQDLLKSYEEKVNKIVEQKANEVTTI